jgi:hypothetical protein
LIEQLPSLPQKWRAQAIDSLGNATLTVTDPQSRSEIWRALRKLLNAHRQYAAAEWALPSDTLDRLEGIYNTFQPTDPIESVSWLFQNATINLPRPKGQGWDADNELAGQMRRDAISATLATAGIDQIFALASAVEVAALVGVAVVEAHGDEAQEEAILTRAVRGADSASEGLAFGMIDVLYKRHGDPWADAFLAKAQAAGWPSTASVRVLLMLPASKPTWDRAAALGQDVERLYWIRVSVPWIQATPDNRSIAVAKLLAADRAYEAVHFLGHSSEGVPGPLLVQVLMEALTSILPEAIKSADLNLFSYSVAGILEELDTSDDVSEEQIGELEWQYLALLNHSKRPPRVLPKLMARIPEFFVEVLSAAFQPVAAAGAQEEASADAPTRRAVARQAFDLLEEWDQVPGDTGGKIEGAVLDAWVTRARSLCADAGLSVYGDLYIGHSFAHSLPGPDEVWPPVPIRDAIERIRSPKLEQGIITGRLNMRGVTTRASDEGGEQERALAQQYQRMATATASEWPRTTDMLEQLASRFEGEGQWYDHDAERIDWSS